MTVIIRKCGQTCNRLFQFAHFYAYCKEYNIELFNPTFWNLKKYFSPQKKENEKARFFSILTALPRGVLCLIRGKIMNIDSQGKNEEAKDVLRRNDYLVWGWEFRDFQNFVKHAAEIRQHFAINAELVKEMSSEFEHRRREFDVAVGVHIRRGDYRTWAEGRYYYDDETYISFMRQMSKLLPDNKILFIVCSNENLDQTQFGNMEAENVKLWFPKQNFINELHLLSKCDKIIGPPSTYSHWASFYGEVPCLHLMSRDHAIDLQDFKVCSG
jgi:hypothetical protein